MSGDTTTQTPVKRERASSPTTTKGSALKSILRSVTTKLGRRQRDEDDVEPESPAKRRKTVAFDMQLNTVKDIDGRTLQDTKTEVITALKDHALGDSEGYDTLKDTFANERRRGGSSPNASFTQDDGTIKPSELVLYVNALTACIPQITRSCAGLVKEILAIPWLGRDGAFVSAYINFLAALVTGQSVYLHHVLAMIVEKFRDFRPVQWRAKDYPDTDRSVMRDRLHNGLGRVLSLFPAARRVLMSILNKEFPYSDESKMIHMAFVENLLRLREYAPDMGADIMALITDRLVKIDVQMQVDLDEVDDDIAAGVVYQLKSSQSNNAGVDDDSDAESVVSDDSDDDELTGKILKATQHIQKMDAIMNTLFQLYTLSFSDPDSDSAKELFENMLTEFVNIILPTYSSRHTQFLVFHFSQLSAHLTDRFAGTLLDVAFGSRYSMVNRQNAAAYLASFAARGAKVPAESVRIICDVLVQYVESYRRRHQETARPDLRRFTPYYALFQSLLYIFCFRWQDLVLEIPDHVDPEDRLSYLGQDLVWMVDLQSLLQANIWSKFNPLRVCHPTIVQEFATISGHLKFLYVHDKIESNRRVFLSSFVSSSVDALRETACHDPHDESWLQLTPYFPFDPYQLPESRHWVDEDYIPWKPFPGFDREDEDEDSDEDADEDGDAEEDTQTDDE